MSVEKEETRVTSSRFLKNSIIRPIFFRLLARSCEIDTVLNTQICTEAAYG